MVSFCSLIAVVSNYARLTLQYTTLGSGSIYGALHKYLYCMYAVHMILSTDWTSFALHSAGSPSNSWHHRNRPEDARILPQKAYHGARRHVRLQWPCTSGFVHKTNRVQTDFSVSVVCSIHLEIFSAC